MKTKNRIKSIKLTFIVTLIISAYLFFAAGFYLALSHDVQAVKSMTVMIVRGQK